jgi:hypothetical protein
MRFWSTGKATTICIAPCNASRCDDILIDGGNSY